MPLATSAQTQQAVLRLGARGRETRPVVVEPPRGQLEVRLGQVSVRLVAVGTRLRLLPLELERVERAVYSAARHCSQVCTRPTPSL